MMFQRTSLQITDAKRLGYTVEQWRAWQWLRPRLKQSHNPWNSRELAHLRFLRWLAQSDRLAEDGAGALEASGQ